MGKLGARRTSGEKAVQSGDIRVVNELPGQLDGCSAVGSSTRNTMPHTESKGLASAERRSAVCNTLYCMSGLGENFP